MTVTFSPPPPFFSLCFSSFSSFFSFSFFVLCFCSFLLYVFLPCGAAEIRILVPRAVVEIQRVLRETRQLFAREQGRSDKRYYQQLALEGNQKKERLAPLIVSVIQHLATALLDQVQAAFKESSEREEAARRDEEAARQVRKKKKKKKRRNGAYPLNHSERLRPRLLRPKLSRGRPLQGNRRHHSRLHRKPSIPRWQRSSLRRKREKRRPKS